jgi:LacI family transcriptional regulator
VCFDDLAWMRFLRPGITAIAQPLNEMGRAAARLILSRINGDPAPFQHQVLSPTLRMRGSVAPPHFAKPAQNKSPASPLRSVAKRKGVRTS